jgi:hypothetical protein
MRHNDSAIIGEKQSYATKHKKMKPYLAAGLGISHDASRAVVHPPINRPSCQPGQWDIIHASYFQDLIL